jgi:hypothetical protein
MRWRINIGGQRYKIVLFLKIAKLSRAPPLRPISWYMIGDYPLPAHCFLGAASGPICKANKANAIGFVPAPRIRTRALSIGSLNTHDGKYHGILQYIKKAL